MKRHEEEELVPPKRQKQNGANDLTLLVNHVLDRLKTHGHMDTKVVDELKEEFMRKISDVAYHQSSKIVHSKLEPYFMDIPESCRCGTPPVHKFPNEGPKRRFLAVRLNTNLGNDHPERQEHGKFVPSPCFLFGFTQLPTFVVGVSCRYLAQGIAIMESILTKRLQLVNHGPTVASDPRPRRHIGQTEVPRPLQNAMNGPHKEPQVLIVGAAAAGLSTAACLSRMGIPYVLLEQDETIGGVWEKRYDRLHLHDIIDNCHLPFMPMPDTYPVYPSRMQFVNYLQSYQRMLGLEVQLRHRVVHAFQPCEGVWEVHAEDLANGSAKTYRYALL